MTVFCQSEECKWNKCGECNRGVISLDCDNECEDFESYLDDAEWQKPYWKRMMLNGKADETCRVLFHGKEIEIKGIKFFVDVNSDYASATEETTGVNCGNRCELEKRIDKIIENIAKCDMPPLETLPIGEYDKRTRRVTPKRVEQEGE